MPVKPESTGFSPSNNSIAACEARRRLTKENREKAKNLRENSIEGRHPGEGRAWQTLTRIELPRWP
jgi:hypothetical protein